MLDRALRIVVLLNLSDKETRVGIVLENPIFRVRRIQHERDARRLAWRGVPRTTQLKDAVGIATDRVDHIRLEAQDDRVVRADRPACPVGEPRIDVQGAEAHARIIRLSGDNSADIHIDIARRIRRHLGVRTLHPSHRLRYDHTGCGRKHATRIRTRHVLVLVPDAPSPPVVGAAMKRG